MKIAHLRFSFHYHCPLTMRKEGNVLFNDALNTFFIYGYMVSDIW